MRAFRLCVGVFALGVSVLVLAAATARAASVSTVAEIPPSLRPWIPWVLDGDEGRDARCPQESDGPQRVCTWPARLSLALGERGGTFVQEWSIYREGTVPLPGDKEHWPATVKVDGKRKPITTSDGSPYVFLSIGRHKVTGAFGWDSLPEFLSIPSETGLVSLRVRGAEIRFPLRERDGRLFLGKRPPQPQAIVSDKVDVSVYRKLTDEQPLQLTTEIRLAISGKNREMVLSRALPEGFAPTAVDSRLPIRLDRDTHVRIQARPGEWTITIRGHRVTSEKTIARPVPDGLWKEGDEVWAFEAMPDVRTVTVEGAKVMDPAQTLMPAGWKSLPAYVMAPGTTLSLMEQRRGNNDPPPEKLELERTLWLDSDGSAFSAHDRVTGELTRSWRLDADDSVRLGRLSVDGRDQSLTRLHDGGPVGVEIRAGRATIDADLRIDHHAGIVRVASFGHAFDNVSATLGLPLGWDLLHATGADHVAGSWIDRWSLSDLLWLLIVAAIVTRLYGIAVGLVAALAFGLVAADEGASMAVMFLVVLAGEAAVRWVKAGPWRTGVRIARVASWALLTVLLIPFGMQQLRFAAHPVVSVRPQPDRFVTFFKKDSERSVVQFSLSPPSPPNEPTAELLSGTSGAGWAGLGATMGRATEGQVYGRSARQERRKVGREGLYPLKGSLDRPAAYGITAPSAPPPFQTTEYDPSIVVQTGEGLPRQSARTVSLSFNGVVTPDRQLHLYLMPPWLNRSLAAAKVVLPLLLAWFLLRRPLRLRGNWLPRAPLVAAAVLFACLPGVARAQEFPSKELLDDLTQRLLEKPDCAPSCTSIDDLSITVSSGVLKATLTVSAAASAAVVLPGDSDAWSPTDVRVDGKAAIVLARRDSGQLLLGQDQGVHRVELSGPLLKRDPIQIPLPMRPHRTTVNARGFDVAGVHEDGAVDESIVLTRIATLSQPPPDAAEESPALPAYLRVERTLSLGRKWQVQTRVVRETPVGAPVVIEIPLLDGESVTTDNVRTEKNRRTVNVSLGPNDTNTEWTSTLSEMSRIHLRADPASAARFGELWRVNAGSMWHVTFSGIPPVRPVGISFVHVPEWRPWPGEELDLTIEKPLGAPGRTLTIDASQLVITPGLHSTDVALDIELRSSQSTTHSIGLPDGADAISVLRDNVVQILRREGRDVVLTVPPGTHRFNLSWRSSTGLSTFLRAPAVDLHLPSANATVTIQLPEKRWLLWLAGPLQGPATLAWIVVAFLGVVSSLLARKAGTPLRSPHWFLLGLGLLWTNWQLGLVVPIGFCALAWRERQVPDPTKPWRYDLSLLLLAALTVVSVVVLLSAIDDGLRGTPDMLIASTVPAPQPLSWYQDRAGAFLPRPLVVSLPMLTYRLLMLAWIVWVGLSSIRWGTWAWSCLRKHGLWMSLEKRFDLPPSP